MRVMVLGLNTEERLQRPWTLILKCAIHLCSSLFVMDISNFIQKCKPVLFSVMVLKRNLEPSLLPIFELLIVLLNFIKIK
jgi:hypothetical protein